MFFCLHLLTKKQPKGPETSLLPPIVPKVIDTKVEEKPLTGVCVCFFNMGSLCVFFFFFENSCVVFRKRLFLFKHLLQSSFVFWWKKTNRL